jgi:hypothetical protein
LLAFWETGNLALPPHLVEGDKNAMRKIDQATVKALELTAPRASTMDAMALRSQMRGGEIFSAFSDQERDRIWGRLQMVEGLVPSLFTFFRDIQYLDVCVDCVKRLSTLSPGQSVSDAMARRCKSVNQEGGQTRIQIAEDTFVSRPGSKIDRKDLGYRQIYAYAMRNYPDMPREPEKEDPVKRSAGKADPAVLRGLAELAGPLGVESRQITALKQYPNSRSTRREDPPSRPLLVTSGPGVPRGQRSGVPRSRALKREDRFPFPRYYKTKQMTIGGSSGGHWKYISEESCSSHVECIFPQHHPPFTSYAGKENQPFNFLDSGTHVNFDFLLRTS